MREDQKVATGRAPEPSGQAEQETTLSRMGWIGLGLSLAAAYGTFAAFLGRFLYPAGPPSRDWMFVVPVNHLAAGQSLRYQTPGGALVNITRRGEEATADAFVALSSTCPHLGCQVHWEGHRNRYFCPCHNGVFSPDGQATEGPPAKAGQALEKYPLKADGGLLYIEVPTAELALGEGKIITSPNDPPGPGHDPCLFTCSLRPFSQSSS